MKHLIACFVALLLLAGCGSGGWRVVKGDEFTIEFPGTPIDTATAAGDYYGAKLYFIPVEGGIDSNIYYAISTYTMADSAEIMGDMIYNLMLKDAEIYAWSMNAILVDSGKVVKSNENIGREYKIFLADNAGVVTMRKFVKGKHMFTLVVITDNYHLDNAEIYRFLDSFKLK